MTTPTPPSTHLRDARLRKALEHAPDAQAAAPAAVREAILRQARQAAAPAPASPAAAPPSPWWKRLFGSPSRAGRPWNTAFASVLLAGVVVGLWWDREVPGPLPDAGTRDLPAAVAPPAPQTPNLPSPPPQPPAPAPTSTPTPAPARPEAREAARPALRAPAPAPLTERRAEPKVAAPNAMPPPQPSAATQEHSRDQRPEAVAQDSMTADATPPPPSTAAAPRATSPGPANDVRASRVAPAPATPSALPAPSQFGANALASRRSATQAKLQEPAAMPHTTGWAALRVQSGAGPVRARGGLPADVAQAIDLMLDTGPTGVPADDPVLLQIQLLQGNGQPLGRLDLGSHSLRWTPAGDGTPRAFSARVEPALSLRVREELTLK